MKFPSEHGTNTGNTANELKRRKNLKAAGKGPSKGQQKRKNNLKKGKVPNGRQNNQQNNEGKVDSNRQSKEKAIKYICQYEDNEKAKNPNLESYFGVYMTLIEKVDGQLEIKINSNVLKNCFLQEGAYTYV